MPTPPPIRTKDALPGGVTNEIPPELGEEDPVRRRDDLTIRGADPKEMAPPRQMSAHLGRKTK